MTSFAQAKAYEPCSQRLKASSLISAGFTSTESRSCRLNLTISKGSTYKPCKWAPLHCGMTRRSSNRIPHPRCPALKLPRLNSGTEFRLGKGAVLGGQQRTSRPEAFDRDVSTERFSIGRIFDREILRPDGFNRCLTRSFDRVSTRHFYSSRHVIILSAANVGSD